LLGGNPEYLAKQELVNKGVEPSVIELATSYVQNVSEEVLKVREDYRNILQKHTAVTEEEKKEVSELGGLRIIGTERHESRRIDNQLRGRAGRQGDPGSSLFYISLEDDLAKRFGGERLMSIYNLFKVDEDTPMQSKMLAKQIENAQRTIEGKNFGIRRQIIEYDDVMNTQRQVIYEERNAVLRGEDSHQKILNLIPDIVANIIGRTVNIGQEPSKWDGEKLNKALEERVLPEGTNYLTESRLEKWDYQTILDRFGHFFKHIKPFFFVGVDGVFMSVSAKLNTAFKFRHSVNVVNPLFVNVFKKNDSFNATVIYTDSLIAFNFFFVTLNNLFNNAV
jgi:preprotein translocase subunit SecA